MRNHCCALSALAGAAAVLASSPAWAHAQLASSNPAANATVAVAPKVITLTFTEKLVPAFSRFELVMVDHKMKVSVKTVVSEDGKTISGTPQGALMKGAYKVTWTAASVDGHRMTGEVAFKVG
jgi:methionine-rich copper-binding protein CopC